MKKKMLIKNKKKEREKEINLREERSGTV